MASIITAQQTGGELSKRLSAAEPGGPRLPLALSAPQEHRLLHALWGADCCMRCGVLPPLCMQPSSWVPQDNKLRLLLGSPLAKLL